MIEMKVGIIGGSDGLGKTLIYFLRDDFDVIISARDHKKGRKIANELGMNNYQQMDKGNLTARENGYVGGYMTKKLVEMAEQQMAGKQQY